MKATLGSIDFITSFFQSEDESKEIKEAINTSSYGSEFVHAALSINKKVVYYYTLFLVEGVMHLEYSKFLYISSLRSCPHIQVFQPLPPL